MKLLVGLGNAEAQYDGTRHNIGFAFADAFARSEKSEFVFEKKYLSFVATVEFLEAKAILAKPTTFVNKSGEAVRKLKLYAKAKVEDIVIIHDDLDIDFGSYKVSFDRSSAGHRGVQSVIDHLKTSAFWRVRLGIANSRLASARRNGTVAHFVLGSFSPAERADLARVFRESLHELSHRINLHR